MPAVGSVSAAIPVNAGNFVWHVWTCTSDAAGAVNTNPITIGPCEIAEVIVVPDSGGTQPTDQFDVTLIDAYGADVLRAGGANLTNAKGTRISLNRPVIHNGTALDVVATNCGNAKKFTMRIATR